MSLLRAMLSAKTPQDAKDGVLSSRIPRLVGESRLLAARQAENLKCEQVIEQYKKSLSTWTSADDFGPPAGQLLAVTAALDEVARRIRKRRDSLGT